MLGEVVREGKGVCGRLMSPAHETQSMREIRLLRGRLPRKGGGLTGMHVDNSFRYIFIYRFSYLLTYYYSFLAHYNKKCFHINWFHLLSPAILSLLVFLLWGHMTFERWLTAKHVFGLFTFYRIFCRDFVYEIKYLVNPQLNILHILTINVIFFYDYSNWGEPSFKIFKIFM